MAQANPGQSSNPRAAPDTPMGPADRRLPR